MHLTGPLGKLEEATSTSLTSSKPEPEPEVGFGRIVVSEIEAPNIHPVFKKRDYSFVSHAWTAITNTYSLITNKVTVVELVTDIKYLGF